MLLVHDGLSEKAAAAMDVAVGHFSDPADLPGLAHCLEHMLFLGTERYPDEGSYNRFLAENGGYSNAYTSTENTNYQFQMVVTDGNGNGTSAEPNAVAAPMPRFKEALDRFSQFFTAPLFTESATDRELNAVHSEHQKNLQSDSRRLFQLKKSLANPAHPFSKFGTGSKDTLDGPDTRAALLAFHKKYYSANMMNLCIVAPMPLDVLEEYVVELFSDIANHDIPHPSGEFAGVEPLLPEHMGHVVHVAPIADIRMLELVWLTPPLSRLYKTKPGCYIGNLLGHEGKGSLLSLLKDNGWADALSAYPYLDTETFGFFRVNINLTKDGVDHINDIVELVYAYLEMVRAEGVQKWLFDEEAAFGEMSFRFMERSEPFHVVQHMSSVMREYPPVDYISGQYLYFEYDPAGIHAVLDCLRPERGNLTVVGKFAEGITDQKERWYETAFRMEEISPDKLQRWQNAKCDGKLHIPLKNNFVPTDFTILGEPLPDGKVDKAGPKRILCNEYVDVHHKLDVTFNRPKAVIVFELKTPFAYLTPWHCMMTKMFTYLLEDSLTEYSYDAAKAGLHYGLNLTLRGMQLSVEGYNHRIQVLLDAALEKMANFRVDPSRFEMIRDQILRDHQNFEKSQPYSHAMYAITYMVETPRWHIVHDCIPCLRDGSISIDSLNAFVPQLLSRMHVVCLAAGNISEEGALDMIASVQATLKFAPLPKVERVERRIVQMPAGEELVLRQVHPNADDNNSAIELYFQTGPQGESFEHDVQLDLIANILNKPAFHELRTVQQLGYMVFEGVSSSYGVRGIYVIVQSTVADPDELCKRIDQFLVDFRRDTLAPMADDVFMDYVTSLIATKAEPEKRLSKRCWKFYSEVNNGSFEYNRQEKEIEALQTVTKADVMAFFDTCLAAGGAARRRAASLVYGNQHPMPKSVASRPDIVEVKDPIAVRNSYPLYPVFGQHSR